MFEPSNSDLIKRIFLLEESQERMRKKVFARICALGKDYEFLFENLELFSELLTIVKEERE